MELLRKRVENREISEKKEQIILNEYAQRF